MKRLAILAFLISSALTPAAALALDAPTTDVVLTISGAVDNPNAGDTAQFDMPMLEALASRTGSMETPWTKGKVTFSGPLFSAVLEAAGAHGKTITVKALNDYSVDLPEEDVLQIKTILATRMDGKEMSVRDKGPLFLIYPFDLQPELYNEKYFGRSVWQIKEVVVTK